MNDTRHEKSVPVTVNLPDEFLRQLSGLAMLDSTSLGFQIHAAVAEYTQCRKQSPTFPAEVEAAKIRLKDRENKSTIDGQIADLGLGSLLLREEE